MICTVRRGYSKIRTGRRDIQQDPYRQEVGTVRSVQAEGGTVRFIQVGGGYSRIRTGRRGIQKDPYRQEGDTVGSVQLGGGGDSVGFVQVGTRIQQDPYRQEVGKVRSVQAGAGGTVRSKASTPDELPYSCYSVMNYLQIYDGDKNDVVNLTLKGEHAKYFSITSIGEKQKNNYFLTYLKKFFLTKFQK